MKTNILSETALLTSLALVFGYAESLVPMPFTLPGMKLGLSNIVILFALLRLGKKNAFIILVLKVLLSSLLFSGMSPFIYSAAGGIFAYAAMIAASKFGMSVRGIGMAGAVFHNMGQVAAACAVLRSFAPTSYLAYLIPLGLAVGFVTGSVADISLKKL